MWFPSTLSHEHESQTFGAQRHASTIGMRVKIASSDVGVWVCTCGIVHAKYACTCTCTCPCTPPVLYTEPDDSGLESTLGVLIDVRFPLLPWSRLCMRLCRCRVCSTDLRRFRNSGGPSPFPLTSSHVGTGEGGIVRKAVYGCVV